MTCPRCSIAEISEDLQECPLCGFTPGASVIVEQVQDEALTAVQEALADRFQVNALLRFGERSFVYLAREIARDRLVALKVIPVANLVDHELANRFEQRAAVAAKLKHSHVVPIYTYGASRRFLWYAMEHVRGQSLAEVLRGTGPMDLSTCLRLLEQVASALDYAHRLDVTHGNLKPTNIFVDDERWVRVSDFTMLDVFGRPAAPQVGSPVLHRPEYMAPEQFYARTVGPSADQYAFAVVVYQCLSGSLPFVGDSFEEVARLHANEPPPRLSNLRPDLPLHVLEAVQRALAKVPGGRFPTVLDFASALASGPAARVSTSRLTPAPRPSSEAPPVLVAAPNRHQWFRSMGLAAVAVAVVGAAITIGVVRPAFVEPLFDAAARVTSSVKGDVDTDPVRGQLHWETLDQPVVAAPTGAETEVSPNARATQPVGKAAANPGTRPPPQRPQMAEPGLLFVSATPWGVLIVDGEPHGNTPKANISLRPGTHTIRIERDGFEPFVREIEIRSGETLRLLDIVLTPRQ